jgi:hypothetical protein
MAVTPSQRQLLQDIITELQTTVAELVLQTAEIAAQSLDIAAQTVAINAMQADIAAQAVDIASTAGNTQRSKDFARLQAEVLIGADPQLADIEAGTHVFPSS